MAGRPKGVAHSDSLFAQEPVGDVRDIYLGGSCGSSTWRKELAIPLLM